MARINHIKYGKQVLLGNMAVGEGSDSVREQL